MLVKQFEAANIQTALKMVKDDLGPEAVILSTREIKIPNHLRPRVEITAGMKTVAAEADEPPSPALPARTTENKPGPDFQQHLTPRETSDLKQIKEMLLSLTYRSKLPEYLRNRQDLMRFYHYLMENELDETLAGGLLEKIAADQPGKIQAPSVILKKFLRAVLKTSSPFDEPVKPGRPRLAALVGPCGCGKTTTLAKLAARLQAEKKFRMAIINLDTYRLGAAEQLRLYAQVMGLPLETVQNLDDFKQALELFDDKDLILIDTSGRSFTDQRIMAELQAYLSTGENPVSLLVLSAAARDRSLKRYLELSRRLPITGLVISMMDEVDVYGNIINNLIKFKKPVCYLAHGQKAPGGLIAATPARLAAMLTGGHLNKPAGKAPGYSDLEKERG